MIKTFKYGMLVLILLTLWTNLDNQALFFWLMLFGGAVGMTFYLFVRFVLWIDDWFSAAAKDFNGFNL